MPCLILEFIDQFTNITLGKKIARNWVLGYFLLAMDAILSVLKIALMINRLSFLRYGMFHAAQ